MSYGYYGGRPQVPFVVKNLLIINALMLLMTFFARGFMIENLSLFYFTSPFFKPFQLISYMFMHGGMGHLFFNMLSLYIFGSVLENVWGSKKFFIYYMVTGIGAGFFHELVMYLQIILADNPDMMEIALGRIPTVGASGAVYGILLAYGMLFPNNTMSLLFPPVTLKAKWMVLIFGVTELLLGISGAQSGVAHFAHLGGMIFGLVLILIWRRQDRDRYYY